MATLVLLGSLLLAALGVTAAAFAVNGYLGAGYLSAGYLSAQRGDHVSAEAAGRLTLSAPGSRAAPSLPQAARRVALQATQKAAPPSTSPAMLTLAMHSRTRFVLLEPPPITGAAPRSSAAAAKPKAKGHATATAVIRPRAHKAAAWPWNLID
jgi:hypothetical protein